MRRRRRCEGARRRAAPSRLGYVLAFCCSCCSRSAAVFFRRGPGRRSLQRVQDPRPRRQGQEVVVAEDRVRGMLKAERANKGARFGRPHRGSEARRGARAAQRQIHGEVASRWIAECSAGSFPCSSWSRSGASSSAAWAAPKAASCRSRAAAPRSTPKTTSRCGSPTSPASTRPRRSCARSSSSSRTRRSTRASAAGFPRACCSSARRARARRCSRARSPARRRCRSSA